MSGLRDRLLRLRGSAASRNELQAGMADASEDQKSADEIEGRTHADEEAQLELNLNVESPHLSSPEESNVVQEEELVLDTEKLPPEWDDHGVRLMHTSEGYFLIREVRYPVEHLHGIHQLHELQQAASGLEAFRKPEERPALRRARAQLGVKLPTNESPSDDSAALSSISTIHPDRLLFLDLETTGLGVGTGNVPFMVGLAYSDNGEFVVEQMLIRHPAEERAMIAYLSGKLIAFTHLVTYNGRTFDWPVLHNRFILNGFRTFSWEPIHIDLLHPSRSVWRNTLASCKLSHVEEERLGIIRTDDVPGSQAPAIYFQYLADGRPEPLLGVFRHNEIDMLSLACLAIRFGHILSGRIGSFVAQPTEHEEILRTGLWLEKMGKIDYAEQLYAKLSEDEHTPIRCLCVLAQRDKKCGNWTRAVLLWQKAIHVAAQSEWADWEAHIELAMYYEHKTKQLEAALTLAELSFSMAQRRYSSFRLDTKRRLELEAIRKRMDRLRSKIGRLSG